MIELYQAEDFPIFQNKVYDTVAEAISCPKGKIALVQDTETGLVYNQAFNNEFMRYDSGYENEQAFSVIFRKHLSDVARIINDHFSGCFLLEIGCGKGFFLKLLQDRGFEAIGCDPAYDGDNPSIIKSLYNPELNLKADAIILRHVLEHIPNPYSFLRQICDGNDGHGRIYIEVPCFEWILKHKAWFDIFYEHVNYFRMRDFYSLFGCIYEAGYLFGDQYLYVVADLSTLKPPSMDEEAYINFPPDFLRTIEKWATRIKNNKISSNLSAVWGAASKGVIFSLLMERAGASIDFIIDISPAKQGKYTAITARKILSPEEAMIALSPGSDIFVMNSNYLEEIRQLSENRFNYIEVDSEIN
ncbi:MAG: class I SAM-dependent methyltransferase [Syntrophales bacterium]|nr:class I SAM-dependent methyltransferase [Syntrophales bacterium]